MTEHPASKPFKVGTSLSDDKFRFYSVAELMDRPELPMLVADFLPSSGMALLYGSPGTYKTFVALSLAYAIAKGLEFMGRATQPGVVLYVATEGQHGLKRRLKALLAYHEHDMNVDMPFCLSAVQLAENADMVKFIVRVKAMETQPSLIILDTLHRCSAGLDENSATDMGALISGAECLIREIGCTVLLVHHSGKDGSKGARGSSALNGAMDTIIKCAKSNGAPVLVCEKQKDWEPFDPIGFSLKAVDIGEGQTSCVVEASDRRRNSPNVDKMLSCLSGFGPSGAMHRQWCDAYVVATGASKSTFDRLLRELKASNIVLQDGQRYRLTAANDDETA